MPVAAPVTMATLPVEEACGPGVSQSAVSEFPSQRVSNAPLRRPQPTYSLVDAPPTFMV